jgi:hypothetical protein
MLKFKVEAVPEGLESHYKATDNGFVLDVEGAVDETVVTTIKSELTAEKKKVDEFRTNNIELKRKVESKGGQTDDITSLVEQQVAEMKEHFTTQLNTLTEERNRLSGDLEKVVLSDAVKEAAIKYGVHDGALPDVLSRAKDVFTVKDGKLAAKTKMVDKEGKPYSVDSWITTLRDNATHLFTPSRGSGARGSTGGGPNNESNRSSVDKISAGLSKL